MPRIRIVLILLLVLLSSSAQAMQAEISSLTVVAGAQRFSVPAFMHDRVLYASVSELSKKLAFPTYGNAETSKIEVRIGETRLKLSDGNPFVVIISQKDNTVSEVYQMPNNVMKTDLAYYAPVTSLLPLLARVMNKHLVLDRSTALLTITTEATGKASIVGAAPGSTTAAQKTKTSTASTAPDATPRGSTTAPVAPVTTKESAAATTPSKSTKPAVDAVPASGSTELAPRAITPEASARFDITHVTVDTRMNGVLIRVHSKKKAGKAECEIDAEGRLLLSVAGVTVDVNELRQTPTDGQSITAVNAEQLGGTARLSFALKGDYTSQRVSRDVNNNDILVSLYKTVDVGKVVREEQSGGKTGDRSKWKLNCIVIDAGHGGRDPGAIGVSGIKEKNITLGMALKLGKLIESNMPGVKVAYTRKDDTFIQLDKRGQMANAAGGKLFVSLHCNATEKKPSNARGFEVYILRPGRTEEAIRIAEFENSVIKLEKDYEARYAKLTDENFILINMAQSAYARYSERFAELLHQKVKGSPQVTSKGVKQAGFYVLVGASMPSVLIEAGFLSNAKEELYLASQEGQEHLVRLFYDAIAAYAVEYEKSLKE